MEPPIKKGKGLRIAQSILLLVWGGIFTGVAVLLMVHFFPLDGPNAIKWYVLILVISLILIIATATAQLWLPWLISYVREKLSSRPSSKELLAKRDQRIEELESLTEKRDAELQDANTRLSALAAESASRQEELDLANRELDNGRRLLHKEKHENRLHQIREAELKQESESLKHLVERRDAELQKAEESLNVLGAELASTQEELALATSKRKTLERNEAIRQGKEILSGMKAQKARIYHLTEGRRDADYLAGLFQKAGWVANRKETSEFEDITDIPEDRAILIKGSSADVLEKLGHALRLLMDVQVVRRKSDSEAIHVLLLRRIAEPGSRW